MKRIDCVKIFADIRRDELVISGVAALTRELYAVAHRDTNLSQIQMGFVTPMALGLALALPQRKVVAMEGDGSALMSLGAFATVANEGPKNLVMIIFDNGTYEGGGRHRTATAGRARLEGIAKEAGIDRCLVARNLEEFQVALKDVLWKDGPSLLVAKTEVIDPADDIPSQPFDMTDCTYRFLKALAEEGLIQPWMEAVSASHRPRT